MFMVYQVAGANATAVNQEISDLLDDISKDLPEGMEFLQMMSVNDIQTDSHVICPSLQRFIRIPIATPIPAPPINKNIKDLRQY